MTKKHQALARVMALALVFVLLFSAFYIIQNANHDCHQENCRICQQLLACENTLQGFALLLCCAVLSCLLAHSWESLGVCQPRFCAFTTLISLKVKLSN